MQNLMLFLLIAQTHMALSCSNADRALCAAAVSICIKVCSCDVIDCFCCAECIARTAAAGATCCECLFPNWEECKDPPNPCESVPDNDRCCGEKPYNAFNHLCCGGKLYENNNLNDCCGGVLFQGVTGMTCCENKYIVHPIDCCILSHDGVDHEIQQVCPGGTCCRESATTFNYVCCEHECSPIGFCHDSSI